MTETPGGASLESGPARDSAALTMVLGSDAAPAVTIPVLPSAESDTPGSGGTTTEMRRSARNRAVTRATATRAAGSLANGCFRSTITTCSAVDPRPEKSLWITLRAATDWLVESCQPAPARFFSTAGAKAPNTRSITNQPLSTILG